MWFVRYWQTCSNGWTFVSLLKNSQARLRFWSINLRTSGILQVKTWQTNSLKLWIIVFSFMFSGLRSQLRVPPRWITHALQTSSDDLMKALSCVCYLSWLYTQDAVASRQKSCKRLKSMAMSKAGSVIASEIYLVICLYLSVTDKKLIRFLSTYFVSFDTCLSNVGYSSVAYDWSSFCFSAGGSHPWVASAPSPKSKS